MNPGLPPGFRSLHDVGGAAWFGGALMGAVGLNGASRAVSDPTDRRPVASAGWARWTPVAAPAIGAHLVGGAGRPAEQLLGAATKLARSRLRRS